MNKENEMSFFCKECGWKFPEELKTKLKKDEESIYCEKCGAESRKEDFIFPKTSQQQQKQGGLWDILSTARKNYLAGKKKLKSKLKDLRESLQNE